MNVKDFLNAQQKNIDDLLTQEMSLLILGYLSQKDEDFKQFLDFFWQEIHKNTTDLIKNVLIQLPEYQYLEAYSNELQDNEQYNILKKIIAEAVQMRIQVSKSVVEDWRKQIND